MRVDRDTPVTELMALLEMGNPCPPPTKVDTWRESIMKFIAENKIIVEEQMSCDGNCYNHPDALVSACYGNVKELIGDAKPKAKRKAGGGK